MKKELEDLLITLGADRIIHQDLFKKMEAYLKKHPKYEDELLLILDPLVKIGATVVENYPLYLKMMEGINVGTISDSFQGLSKAGLSPEQYKDAYFKVLEKPYQLIPHDLVFVLRRTLNPTSQQFHDLYLMMMDSKRGDNVTFRQCCISMQESKFTIASELPYIKTALRSPAKAIMVLDALQDLGLNKDKHRAIYELFFKNDHIFTLTTIDQLSKILMKLKSIKEKSAALDDVKQCEAVIKTLIEECREEDRVTEGPLNKSEETRELERLLRVIIASDNDAIDMKYNEQVGYILIIQNEPEIYMSLLLRQVNFNHLALTESEVNALGAKIEAFSKDFNPPRIETNVIVSRLPNAAKQALAIYKGNHYKGMNRLFRGVAQTQEDVWVAPAMGKNNLLANFLCGCLVNWSAAELPRLLHDSEERRLIEHMLRAKKMDIEACKKNEVLYQDLLSESLKDEIISREEYDYLKGLFEQLSSFFPHYEIVYRGENLDKAEKEGELEIRARRLANIVFLPSVASCTVGEGSTASDFQTSGAERTLIELTSSPIISESEKEVLIPHGSSFLYINHPGGGFFAHEIRSPAIVPPEHYWPMVALADAYRLYLSKPYKHEADWVCVDGIKVYRPNHGLAHTYRVMSYIPVVVDYFAHHAKDDQFKVFCQSLTSTEQEWLQVGAAYSVTWRENEGSARDNFEQYQEMRDAFMKHVEGFLKEHPPKKADIKMEARLIEVVRYAGNPSYESSSSNSAADADERQYRNFLHRILSVAHKLDLVRCYNPDEFQKAIHLCVELSADSPDQKMDYQRMLRYAIDLNKAHGDELHTELSSSGEYVRASQGYRTPFGKVSTNLRQLKEITDTVTRPKLTEKYQFRTDIP